MTCSNCGNGFVETTGDLPFRSDYLGRDVIIPNIKWWQCVGCSRKYLDGNAADQVIDFVRQAEGVGE